MKKLVIIIIASVVLAGCTTSNPFYYKYEKGDCMTHRFEDIDEKLDLRFEWKYDTLYLRWNQTDNDDFDAYYLVRSDSSTCPYYYSGGDYHEVITRKSLTYFKDEVNSGDEFYYRMCVREKDKEVNCGSVWKVSIY